MSSVQARTDPAADASGEQAIDLNLEVVVIPVSDVDRARDFYAGLIALLFLTPPLGTALGAAPAGRQGRWSTSESTTTS
jgi:uncharacterized membrane protein